MNNEYALEIDLLAISLTKPATRFGVPFMPFFISMIVCMLGWMFFQATAILEGIWNACLFLTLWIFVYVFMFFKSKNDIFGLNIFLVKSIYFRPNPSRQLWGNMDSYAS
jgi:type IV secretory pathway VirB3-like protein